MYLCCMYVCNEWICKWLCYTYWCTDMHAYIHPYIHTYMQQVEAAIQNFSAGILVAAIGDELFPLLNMPSMYVYIHVYACMHIQAYAFIYKHMYSYMCMHVCIYKHRNCCCSYWRWAVSSSKHAKYVCMYAYTSICMLLGVHAHTPSMYVCMHVCVYVCMYVCIKQF